ncbi:hypothetical protein KPH14_006619 [Odynerus spinipes]|uniref:UMA domain-containing protein n=1 Tax=Odynerus spinipes TaxID=1348599 RepID=A0AAD9VRJ9_9HYME|nr:hypothetical protein KPH14_006619 [Odynerus spinipes]
MAAVLKKSYTVFARAFGKRERIVVRSLGSTHPVGKKCGSGRRRLAISLGVLAGAAATCGSVLYLLDSSVKASSGMQATPPSYPWEFDGVFSSLNHTALRRGWQVYRNVCSTCHSLRYVSFMDLIDVSHTREEMTAIAAEYEVEDGPNDEGNYYTRPGKLTDRVPSPFPNEEAAKAANNGAYPPDLSHVVLARRNGQNYIFSLLTGFMDPPAGVELMDTQTFNLYFPGGAINMVEMLQDGAVDYEDGTPATRSQMSKDIVEFLVWTSSQDHDIRKLMSMKAIGILILLLITMLHRIPPTSRCGGVGPINKRTGISEISWQSMTTKENAIWSVSNNCIYLITVLFLHCCSKFLHKMSWFFGKKKHHKESLAESFEDLTTIPPNIPEETPQPSTGLYPLISGVPTYPIPSTDLPKQNQQADVQHYLNGVPFKLCKQLENNMNNDFEIDRLRVNEIMSFINRIEEQNFDYEFSLEKSVISEMNSANDE